MNIGIQHIEDEGNTKRMLTIQLEAARQMVIDMRAQWKHNETDNNRFALQTALTVVNGLDKMLWKYD